MTSFPETSSDWFRTYHTPPDPHAVIVFFPHAGGSASFFHPFSAQLAPEYGAICVQYPGRQDRRSEPSVTSIGEMSDTLFRELKTWQGSNLVFFGHSMGAVIAYETVLRIRAAGEAEPMMLFASGRRAPSLYRDDLAGFTGDEALIRELSTLGGTARELLDDPEFLRAALPAMRGDYQAMSAYRHCAGERISCPLRVLTGDDDERVTDDEARAWSGHTTGAFSYRTFPGGHFYLQSQMVAVLDDLRRHLEPLLGERT